MIIQSTHVWIDGTFVPQQLEIEDILEFDGLFLAKSSGSLINVT